MSQIIWTVLWIAISTVLSLYHGGDAELKYFG